MKIMGCPLVHLQLVAVSTMFASAMHLKFGSNVASHGQSWSGIQVLGVGLERTGTESLNAALKLLGFKSSHGFEEVYHDWDNWVAWHCGGWSKKHEWLREMQYTALTDNPYRAYFPEMMAEYPDMKMILSVHPGGAEGWSNSTGELLVLVKESPEKYTSWNQYVIDTVPKDKLLIFNPTQGFKPLAAFLGVPEPQDPYPEIKQNILYQLTSREIEFGPRLEKEGCPDGQPADLRQYAYDTGNLSKSL